MSGKRVPTHAEVVAKRTAFEKKRESAWEEEAMQVKKQWSRDTQSTCSRVAWDGECVFEAVDDRLEIRSWPDYELLGSHPIGGEILQMSVSRNGWAVYLKKNTEGGTSVHAVSWDHDLKCVGDVQELPVENASFVAFHHSAFFIAVATNKELLLWNPCRKEAYFRVVENDRIGHVVFDDGVKVWYQVGQRIRMLDLNLNKVTRTLSGFEGCVVSLDISKEDQPVILTNHEGKQYQCNRHLLSRTLTGFKGYVASLDVSSDEEWVVLGTHDGALYRCHLRQGNVFEECEKRHLHAVYGVAIDDANNRIITAADKNIRFWKLSDGSFISAVSAQETEVGYFEYNPQRRELLSMGKKEKIRWWELNYA